MRSGAPKRFHRRTFNHFKLLRQHFQSTGGAAAEARAPRKLFAAAAVRRDATPTFGATSRVLPVPDLGGPAMPRAYHFRAHIQPFQPVTTPFPGQSGVKQPFPQPLPGSSRTTPDAGGRQRIGSPATKDKLSTIPARCTLFVLERQSIDLHIEHWELPDEPIQGVVTPRSLEPPPRGALRFPFVAHW